MYFTSCKPVDRNTERDALCGTREVREGERGRETMQPVCVCVCERDRNVALVFMMNSECTWLHGSEWYRVKWVT